MKKYVTNKRWTINGFPQNEKSKFFLRKEEKKTTLELKVSGSGINEGSLILNAETAIILKNYLSTTARNV